MKGTDVLQHAMLGLLLSPSTLTPALFLDRALLAPTLLPPAPGVFGDNAQCLIEGK